MRNYEPNQTNHFVPLIVFIDNYLQGQAVLIHYIYENFGAHWYWCGIDTYSMPLEILENISCFGLIVNEIRAYRLCA